MASRSTLEVTDTLRNASDARIEEAVASADPVILSTILAQFGLADGLAVLPRGLSAMSGSDRAAPPPFRDPADENLVRERAAAMLAALRDGDLVVESAPSRAEMHRLLELTFDHPIEHDQVDYWAEEFGVDPVSRALPPVERGEGRWAESPPSVLIVGAGMSGISAAVHLSKAGIPFTIIERNSGVGGTWFENHYPGTRVDVDSRAYSYTFEPDFDWKHHYALQGELLTYFNSVVDKHELREHIVFEREVDRAQWDESAGEWTVELTGPNGPETMSANALVMAVGLFNRPILPSIPGLSEFTGEMLHTARWNDSFNPEGKSVAVIGTGSSGVQIVAPLAVDAKTLHVFQRSGTWLANVPNYTSEISENERWLLRNVPFYLHWVRILQMYSIGDTRAPLMSVDPEWDRPDSVSEVNERLRNGLMAYLETKLGDRPDLLAQCVPAYPPLAKRLPKDNGWYDAIKRPNVTLVSDPITRFDSSGLFTASGEHYEFDAIVLATGFAATNYLQPMELVGRDGVPLAQAWGEDGARAYLGMTMPHFPNLFMLYGPNTNPRAGSPASWGEMQARYIVSALNHLISEGSQSLEVKEQVFREFNDLLDERLKDMIWSDPRQTSYYVNEHGRIATNGPWLNAEYWGWTRQFAPDQYEVR